MKVIQFDRYGPPHEVCQCIDVPPPGPPAADEVLVTVEACSINPADLLIIEGRYPGPKHLPARLGVEAAGRIIATGEAVAGLRNGQRVMLLGRTNWAEQVLTAAQNVIPVDDNLDPLQAAMMKVNPPTAMLLLSNYVQLNQGDWIIQNAANSAVGCHIVRLARARGIRTVNVVRRESAVGPITALGGDLVLLDGEDLAHRVRNEVGEASLSLAMDAIGGEACLHLAQSLSDGGTVVNYGFLSGQPCMITPTEAIVRDISLRGFWLVNHLTKGSRQDVEAIYAEVAALIMDGTIVAPIEATYSLEQVEVALAHAGRDARHGKILFTPAATIETH